MTTEQKPLNSGFGPETTAREVIAGCDLTGKIAIVTGGYSGIGLETTRVDQEPSGVLPWAIDPDFAGRLWTLSEQMSGVKFND